MLLQFSGISIAFSCLFITWISAGPIEDANLLKKYRKMKSYMNERVDPCENFYEFTCGNWANIHPAEGERDMETNYLLVIKQAFDKQAVAMLETVGDTADTALDRKIKNFYKSCMKLKQGVQTQSVLDVLSEFGKMPAVFQDDWNEDQFDWVETLALVIKTYDYSIMIGFEVLADVHDNSRNRIYIGQSEFVLESKSIYLDEVGKSYRDMYRLSITMQLNALLGLELDKAIVVADEIVEFEISLARGMMENKSDRSLKKLLLNTTVEELQQKYAPTFDVKKFMSIILGEIPTDVIYEYVPNYLKNLKEVVEKTEKRIVANYIYYNVAKEFELSASDTDEEHEKKCLEKLNENFAKNIDNMVYRRFNNSKAAEDDIQRIWHELKALFKAKLESDTAVKWLTQATRKTAIDKLEFLKLEINSYMDRNFTQEFEELETNEHDYVGNLKNITKLESKRAIAKLHGPVTPVEAGETLSVTPANILVENVVKIPVALLQPYYVWAPNFPDALKFGVTGFLLAHELIHAFDETGRQFGKQGNLIDWWDAESILEFEQRRACFRDQYHDYVYGKKRLPISERQAENIADNSGLKLAFEAYMNARRNAVGKSIDEMPGMNYTSKQLFFIGFAQFWCSDVENYLINLQTETDEHTPAKFRAIGTISNFPEFSEAFQCKVGSKMNPIKKCDMF